MRTLPDIIHQAIPRRCEWPSGCTNRPTHQPAEHTLYLCLTHVMDVLATCPESQWARSFEPIHSRLDAERAS